MSIAPEITIEGWFKPDNLMGCLLTVVETTSKGGSRERLKISLVNSVFHSSYLVPINNFTSSNLSIDNYIQGA